MTERAAERAQLFETADGHRWTRMFVASLRGNRRASAVPRTARRYKAHSLVLAPLLLLVAINAQPAEDEAGFVPLFNGRDLSGWEGDTALWFVEAGSLVGRSPGIGHNDFLCSTSRYGDFELRLSFRLKEGKGNSGIQFRSRKIRSHVSGYQADIGEKYWGCLYDEARRSKVLVQAPPSLDAALRKNGWNDYVIRADGDRIELWLNGVRTADYRETDPTIERAGIIALQIHSGGPLEIRFRNVRIKELTAAR